MRFSVGDKVLFKTWDELRDEFGISEEGYIPCYLSFNPEMDEIIDRETVYTIESIDDLDCIHLEDFEEKEYMISEDMLKSATEGSNNVPKTEVYPIEWEGSFEFLSKIRTKKTEHISSSYNSIEKLYKNIFETLLMSSNYKMGAYLGDYSANPKYLQTAFNESIGLIFLREKTYTEEELANFQNFWDEKNAEVINIGNKVIYKVENTYYTFISGARDLKEVDLIRGLINHLCSTYELNPDQQILEAIINKDIDSWNKRGTEIIDEIMRQQRRAEILNQIPSIRERLVEVQGRGLQNAVDVKKGEYNNALKNLNRVWESYQEAIKAKMWAEHLNKDEKIEFFIQYLMQDVDNIVKLERDSRRIYIRILQPFLFFNDEDWEVVRGNTLRNYNHRYVFDAIFKREAVLLFEQGIYFNFNNGEVSKWNDYDPQTLGFPNPHINYHNCFGENAHKINKAITTGEFDQAYIQIKSAVAGVNAAEAPTMNPFKDYFSQYNNIPCITIVETGEVMTSDQANEYFRKKKGE